MQNPAVLQNQPEKNRPHDRHKPASGLILIVDQTAIEGKAAIWSTILSKS
jgi:hypothetical protein